MYGMPRIETVSESVLAFSLYEDTTLREMWIQFLLAAGFVSLLCLVALFTNFSWIGTLVIFGIYIAIVWFVYRMIFSTFRYEFDCARSEIRITRNVYGRKPRHKRLPITPSNQLFIVATCDEQGTERMLICIQKRWASRLLLSVIPNSTSSKKQIAQQVDRVARHLEIENRGYVSMWHYCWLLVTLRFWSV